MLWLCLYFPALPLDVFTRLDDNSAQQAILVAEQQRVYYANPKARKSGTTPGQSIATAHALCGQPRIIERDPVKEANALTQLARHCYQFTPMVSPQAPDSILLEIKGSLKLFRGLTPLGKQLAKEINTLGYHHRQGTGLTPKAAWLAARATLEQGQPATETTLKKIPLKLLDISAKQRSLLKEMGFSTLGELLDLPSAAVGKRFGQEFLHYLQQITGERPDPRQPIQFANEFTSELFYIDGLETTQALLFPTRRLLDELSRYLRYRQLYCRGFSWTFERFKGRKHPLTIRLSKPQNNAANFFALTRIKLEQLSLSGAVHNVSLTANNFSPAIAHNQRLFNLFDGSTTPQNNSSPELLMDKLNARLGTHNLFGIAPADQHVPELAWRSIASGELGLTDNETATQLKGKLRPSWLLNRPAPLGQQQGSLYWQGKKLSLLRGPERIDSHWWQNRGVCRDYFIARLEEGGLYWIYREVKGKRWFLHGLFG